MEIGTQPIKLNWKIKFASGILSGIFFTVCLYSIDLLIFKAIKSLDNYIIQGVIFGFLMGITYPFLMSKINRKLSSKIQKSLKPTLEDGELIENHGPANLFKGIEGTGGKLFLTNLNAIFVAHKVNIQKGETKIPYTTILEVEKRKTARLIDNGIRIKTSNDKNFDFVVNDRDVWLEKLSEKIK